METRITIGRYQFLMCSEERHLACPGVIKPVFNDEAFHVCSCPCHYGGERTTGVGGSPDAAKGRV